MRTLLVVAAIILPSISAPADGISQGAGTLTSPAAVGTNLYPFIDQGHNRNITTTSGSPTATVDNPAGLTVGMSVWISPTFPFGAWITAINGNTLTISDNATVTNSSPVAVQFGQSRWDPNSSLLANTIGIRVGYFGAAALGDWTWVAHDKTMRIDGNFGSGAFSSLVSIAGNGSAGGFFGSRASDYVSSGFTAGGVSYALNDVANNPRSVWGHYFQTRVTSPNAALSFGFENTVKNEGAAGTVLNPYKTNATNAQVNGRFDCGIVSTDLNCSTALHIIKTNARYSSSALIFGNDALDMSGNAHPGVDFAQNQGLNWWFADGSISWQMFASAGAAGGTFDLQNAGAIVVSATSDPSLKLNNSSAGHSVTLTGGTVAAGTATCPSGTIGGQIVQGCQVINVSGSTRYLPFF